MGSPMDQARKAPMARGLIDEPAQESVVQRIRVWLTEGQFSVLNVAGPREEKRPGVYACVAVMLDACFRGNTRPETDADTDY